MITQQKTKKPPPRECHPAKPTKDYTILRRLFPYYTPFEIRAKLISLRHSCSSNEALFWRVRREAWFTRCRGQRKDNMIRTKQRLTKTDMIDEVFLLRCELNLIWEFLRAKSNKDYPDTPLPVGTFTDWQTTH